MFPNLKSSAILCRLDPVRKLEAGPDHLPRVDFQLGPVRGPSSSVNPPLVVELVPLVLRKVVRLPPRLVLLAHDGAGRAHERLDAWEHLHHPRPALYLAVGALLDVVRAQALPVRGRQGLALADPRLLRRRPAGPVDRHEPEHGARQRQSGGRLLDAYLRYCNKERPKEKLGWMSPVQYRRSLGLAV